MVFSDWFKLPEEGNFIQRWWWRRYNRKLKKMFSCHKCGADLIQEKGYFECPKCKHEYKY